VVPVIRLAIVDEHEIFRRGLAACLAEDPAIDVRFCSSTGPLTEPVDVAVVSAPTVVYNSFDCPLIVCGKLPSPGSDTDGRNQILGVFARNTLNTDQLLAAVHAAAVGLHVGAEVQRGSGSAGDLSQRHLRVLQLLAEGADTLEIAESLRYSERTVKSLIQDVEQYLGARTRAQAVAMGVRQGLI
jgi:DNA-binding NarL/FixJ family response regulator